MQKSGLVCAVLLGLSTPQTSWASFYPPDYVVFSSCQQQGAVEVCALNRPYGHYPRLRIVYRGELQAEHWGRISAYIAFNGRQLLAALSNVNYQDSVTVGGPAAVRICRAGVKEGPEDDLPPYNRTCEHTPEPAGEVLWEADPIPADEAQLFFYAYDYNRPNVWDVSVAFVSDDGQWDSLNGQNYKFHFE